MELLPTPPGACLSTKITAAATVAVARIGAVLLTQKRGHLPSAERIAVVLEAELVVVAVTPRPALRLVAVSNRTPTTPRHVGTGSLHDLSDPLSRQPETNSDARQRFPGRVPTQHLSVPLPNVCSRSTVRRPSSVIHVKLSPNGKVTPR